MYYMDMKKPIFIMLGAFAVYIGGLYIFTERYHFNIFTAGINSAEVADISDTKSGKFNPLPLVAPVVRKENPEIKITPKPSQEENLPALETTEENNVSLPPAENLTPAATEEILPAADVRTETAVPVSSAPAPAEAAAPAEAQSAPSVAAEPESAVVEEQAKPEPPKPEAAKEPASAAASDNNPERENKPAVTRRKIIEPQKIGDGEDESIVYIEPPAPAPVKKAAAKKKASAPKKEVVKKVEVKASQTAEQKPEEPKGPQTLSEADLVDIMTLPVKPFLDMRYATADNFMGEQLYPANKCYLKRNAANALMRALMYASEAEVPFSLCVYDCYRPLSVQKRMWAKMPNSGYVSSPSTGSNHNRGTAVDLGPCSLDGNPLPAPTDFDEFIPAASADAGSNVVAPAALKNREALQEIMKKAGFSTIKKEWWHFDFRGAENYPVLDIPFDKP